MTRRINLLFSRLFVLHSRFDGKTFRRTFYHLAARGDHAVKSERKQILVPDIPAGTAAVDEGQMPIPAELCNRTPCTLGNRQAVVPERVIYIKKYYLPVTHLTLSFLSYCAYNIHA